MNIFFRELKANSKALVIWSICMFLLVVSGMGKYTAYSSGGQQSDISKALPDSVKALLGFGTLDVTTMSGFFVLLFSYIVLTAAIHAALLGAGIIAKEERDKTTEFLIPKPVSRGKIFGAKLLASLLNVLVLNMVTLISSILMVNAYNKGASVTGEVLRLMLSMFFVQLIFLSLGILIAAFIKKSKGAGSLTTGILLFSFVIAKLTDMTHKLNFLNLLSPFKYFNYDKIVIEGSLNLVTAVLALLLAMALTGSAYYFYQRRDMNI